MRRERERTGKVKLEETRLEFCALGGSWHLGVER